MTHPRLQDFLWSGLLLPAEYPRGPGRYTRGMPSQCSGLVEGDTNSRANHPAIPVLICCGSPPACSAYRPVALIHLLSLQYCRWTPAGLSRGGVVLLLLLLLLPFSRVLSHASRAFEQPSPPSVQPACLQMRWVWQEFFGGWKARETSPRGGHRGVSFVRGGSERTGTGAAAARLVCAAAIDCPGKDSLARLSRAGERDGNR